MALLLSSFVSSPLGLLVTSIVIVALALVWAYNRLWPKPIPGIPFNKEAVENLFGDTPALLKAFQKTGLVFPWFAEQVIKHKSIIVQTFPYPFSKPYIVISDHRESQDILLRRTKEFDRSDFMGDVFRGITPDFHITRKSHEAGFKNNRALLKDLMAPAFLNQTAAPRIYTCLEQLVKLWTIKTDMSQGHPFDAAWDVHNATLDAVAAVAFGLDISITGHQVQLLKEANNFHLPPNVDEIVEFPRAPRPVEFAAIVTLVDTCEITVKSPFPLIHHWFVRQRPSYRKAHMIKENLILGQLEEGIQRYKQGDRSTRSAIDYVIQRESDRAKKNETQPEYKSRAIIDELFGFIIGGHDTTSSTVRWGFKYLSANQQAQSKLRSALREGFEVAATERRNPTVNEITGSRIPYLDAVIEETSRVGTIAPGIMRRAMVDTTILGHKVPKGTEVMMLQNGAGFLSRSIDVEEGSRSDSSRSAHYQYGSWDDADRSQFKPERWLKLDEDGIEVFDATAGPHLAFGLGPRACFGRRLAYIQMRIIFTMVIWNFELGTLSSDLSDVTGDEGLTRSPNKCFLRTQRAKW